jgi:hypothetical protein
VQNDYFLSWSDVAAVGLALDIAGALILVAALITKSAALIAKEAPETVYAGGFEPEFAVAVMPPEVREGLCRQHAEARVGGPVLALGFVLQGAALFLPSDSLDTTSERLVALALVAVVLVGGYVTLWRVVVPSLARRTLEAVKAAPKS